MNPFYEHRQVVTFADTNVVGNVYFTHYFEWQGRCRERFLADQAPEVLQELTRDLALVTADCACEFFAELYALDEVSIRMSLGGIEANRVTMEFHYYRLGAGPALLVARGRQTIACMRRGSGGALHPTEIPGPLRRALDPYRPVPAA
ncbi:MULTISPECIES: acyl-CoA thioesterase [Nonomuraea]|uniref:Acyl-CoA thioesterase n=1 Tax=Nonomuraea ferruginea TaxID=46174 RepID=A0ABT4T7C3_9ACTN|nr:MULTISPECIES: acyl-CoA thioesterase [Nonomuraea]MDA0645050.1 acyl-CoA thioesterase [Nonomuraea ferruginea]TXK40171.1 acyl-CoA thioesterase [Nonomuraea sp. C10]